MLERHSILRDMHPQVPSHIHEDTGTTHVEQSATVEQRVVAARPRLLRLARLNGVSPEAVEDIVQETLLEAWYHLSYLREPDRVDAWLDGICRNMCRRWRRTFHTTLHRYEHLSAQREEEREGLEDIPDSPAPDPLEKLSRQEMEMLLDRALGHLSKTAREAVELWYLAEYPQREVARTLRISIGALEERLRRARHQLRQVLNGELRAEAEALDLNVSPEPALGWRETRLWCILCGRHHLRGMFEPLSEDRISLCLRCPECSPCYGGDIIRTGGFFPLGRLRSFRPALNHQRRMDLPYWIQAVAEGKQHCLRCGEIVSLRLLGPDQRTAPLPFWQGLSLILDCSACGQLCSTYPSEVVCFTHPAAQQFMALPDGSTNRKHLWCTQVSQSSAFV